ncbi:MAG: DUF1015 domain-containing protein [Bacillota bacterium]
MATIKPFKAIRPKENLVSKIASLPYDVISKKEAKEEIKRNKYSFLNVIRSEATFENEIDPYSDKVYKRAKNNLKNMIEKKYFTKEEDECLYIYRQIMNGRKQTGLVSLNSIDEYLKGDIKKHEHTRIKKEKDRINHIDTCDANTAPIFLTYKNNKKINRIINMWIESYNPIYNFTSDDEIKHIIWKIDDIKTINNIENIFDKKIDSLYIADGHHRTEAAAKVGLKRRKQDENYTGKEPYNYFLSVIFPDKELYIMDYNRVVKDLNGLTNDEFIKEIEKKFKIEKINKENIYRPKKTHEFGMYFEKKWYKLTAKDNSFEKTNLVEKLDVSILQNNVLEPILGIKDPRKSNRIKFIGGIRGLKTLESEVNENKMKVAFAMYPTSIEELMDIADNDLIMPPKSTWFEPKLRSGIFINQLSN